MEEKSKFKEGKVIYTISKYPNGKYYNNEINNRSSTYQSVGPFDTIKQAEQMLIKHRPKAKKIKKISRPESAEYTHNGIPGKYDFDDPKLGYSKINNKYIAVTASQSKTFKTETGAKRWLEKQGYKQVSKNSKSKKPTKSKQLKSFKDLEQKKIKTKSINRNSKPRKAQIDELEYSLDPDSIEYVAYFS